MSTAIDPLAGIYRSGLMWFDQRNGTATRGFDQVEGIKTIGSAAFQKGGGLGGVALLAVAAPVEIGNRVWLDADLNGRQDADEPAINGAVVELWTADATATPASSSPLARRRRSTDSPARTTSAPTIRTSQGTMARRPSSTTRPTCSCSKPAAR